MSPRDRRDALEGRFPVWTPRAIHEWFEQSADLFPERPFVVTDDRTVTYRQMKTWVYTLAKGLSRHGVGRGSHVALLLGNYPEYIALKYALSRLGAVMIPINTLLEARELEFVLRQSEASVLVTMTAFRGRDYLSMLDQVAPGWNEAEGSPELRDLQLVVQFATGSSGNAAARPGVLSLADVEVGPRDGVELPEGPGPFDISMMLYTSGTTGKPKGVLWTHNQDACLGFGGALSRAFGDGWRVQSALPLFHSFANNEVLNAAMFVGGAVIPRTSFDVNDFLRAIERHRPNEIVTVPTMVVALCEEPATSAADTASLVGLMCAGAPAPVWLWERATTALGVDELTTGYGMTETGGGPVMSRPEDGVEHVANTVGRIKYGGPAGLAERGGLLAEFRVVDPVSGELLPDGREGELISRGPTNAVGYWKLPEETAATFRDGWVYSGDLGRVLPNDTIVLTGRKKDLIRCGSENFAPKEVEDLLTSHPGVSQSFVVGIPDVKWGEIPYAWVVPDPGSDVQTQELVDLCRSNLAVFKRPKIIRFITSAQLPKTPTGKIKRFALVKLAADHGAT